MLKHIHIGISIIQMKVFQSRSIYIVFDFI